jgi:hypothetical protein
MALGCSGPMVKAKADSLRATLTSTERFIPRVGWDACELLAHNGAPAKVESQETEHTRSMSWWYYDYDSHGVREAHLVTLRWQPSSLGGRSPWVIVYVGW